jgi:hypothetical protein
MQEISVVSGLEFVVKKLKLRLKSALSVKMRRVSAQSKLTSLSWSLTSHQAPRNLGAIN